MPYKSRLWLIILLHLFCHTRCDIRFDALKSLSNLDFTIFDDSFIGNNVKINFELTDEMVAESSNLSLNFQSHYGIEASTLIISTFEMEYANYKKSAKKFNEYIKNTKDSLLMIIEPESNFTYMNIINHPYYFIIIKTTNDDFQIYEIHAKAKKSILLVIYNSKIDNYEYFNQDFYDRRRDFKKSEIKVTYFEDEWLSFDKNGQLMGFSGSMFKHFIDYFNFTPKYFKATGYGTKNKSNMWNGMIGELISNKVDVGNIQFQ